MNLRKLWAVVGERVMYLLFGGWNYDGGGGWDNFLGAHDTLGAAIAAGEWWAASEDADWVWWHVVDLSTKQVVRESDTCESA